METNIDNNMMNAFTFLNLGPAADHVILICTQKDFQFTVNDKDCVSLTITKLWQCAGLHDLSVCVAGN